MSELDRKQAERLGRPTTVWENVSKPLVKELMNATAVFTPETENFEEIQEITMGLRVYGLKYDLVKLVEDEDYRERKNQQLLSHRGVKRKLKTINRGQEEKA